MQTKDIQNAGSEKIKALKIIMDKPKSVLNFGLD
jgi:hypothetical protein